MENIPLEDRGVPLVAVGNKIFMGLDQIQENLEPEIKKLQNSSDYKCILEKYCAQVNQSEQSEPVINISKVTLPIITAAAAADSINPCAIGVLIFLISFLFLSSNQSKKRTLIISAIYILSVYITYTLAGIGILEFLSKVSFLSTITRIFALLILIFGAINIRDALMKKGTLVIPAKTKPWIEKWVYRASIPAAIILGIIVSAVELPCTGGMYMAILALLANTTTKTQAVWYLLYYNIIFILPLVIVTLLFIRGVEGHKMHEWMEKHKHKTRMIIGLILVILGLLLLFL
jgi:cytochrome c biogenesis protein CcdA